MATRQKTVRYSLGNTVTCEGDIDRVWMFTSSGSVWTDETTDAGDSGTGDVAFTGAVGDILYICHDEQFDAVWVDVTTAPAGGVRTWEYYNGSTWAALTNTYLTGNANLTVDTSFYFTPPSDWAATAVNGDANRYAIRGRVTTLYTTAGTAAVISIAPYDNICTGAAGGTKTLEIPETTSRTFRDVILRVWTHTPILGSWDRWLVRAKLGSAAWSNAENVNAVGPIPAPTESTSFVAYYDLTSYFTTNFTSTSHDLQVEVAQLQRNVNATIDNNRRHYSAEILITYEFADTATTQIQTVMIPLDSISGGLSTTATNIGGTNGIPQLTSSGFLKEPSVTIKDLYIIFEANANEAGTTDYDFYGQIDSDTEVNLATFDAENQSDFYACIIWRQPSLTTTSAHTLKARVTSVTGATFAELGAVLVVTYTYDESTVTTRTVSLQLPFMLNNSFAQGTASGTEAVARIPIFIEDASPTLLQSGIGLYLHQNSDPGNYQLLVGTQTARAYTVPSADVSGMTPIHHRFDSGAAAGTGGLTLARGLNTIIVKGRADTTPAGVGGECGIIYLNYSCTANASKRTSCVWTIQRSTSMSANQRTAITITGFVPEATYYLNHAGIIITEINQQALSNSRFAIQLASGYGWFYGRSGSAGNIDTSLGSRLLMEHITDCFKRWASDTQAQRVDVEGSISAIIASNSSAGRQAVLMVLCYHDYSYSISGTIAGSGGGTVNWEAYSKQLGEKIASGSRTGNGVYSATWFDDTSSDVFVTAREDATHVGRSDDGTPA